jgi:hypothetical protein
MKPSREKIEAAVAVAMAVDAVVAAEAAAATEEAAAVATVGVTTASLAGKTSGAGKGERVKGVPCHFPLSLFTYSPA